MKRATPLLVVLGLCAATWAWADAPSTEDTDDTEAPSLIEPLVFDHSRHAAAFQRSGVSCLDCHPVGLYTPSGEGTAPPVEELPPPMSSCHACHRGELVRAPKQATSSCMACHDDREALLPDTHAAGWVELHGPAARDRQADCSDCHEPDRCVTCHQDRGPLSEDPHGPGFRSFHGVEARLDPASCSSCHSGESCTKCHSTGGIPW